MNFSEKLIKLRKEKGLSQEELGEKLNVTRQTISKWELGQTTPEMSKLVEISKLFEVTLDELTENKSIENENVENNNIEGNHTKRNTIIIILLVVALLALVVFGVNKICKNFVGGILGGALDAQNAAMSQAQGMQDILGNIIQGSQNLLEQQAGKQEDFLQNGQDFMNQALQKGQDFIDNTGFDQEVFNTSFELYNGTQSGFFVKHLIDIIVTNNKKEKDKTITVIYQGVSVSEPKEIQNLKTKFEGMTQYEVSFEYDENGYIYQVDIMDLN